MTRISDETYFALYRAEVAEEVIDCEAWARSYHERFDHVRSSPFVVKDDSARRTQWDFYAAQHGGLKAMNPDGTWRPWSPDELRA